MRGIAVTLALAPLAASIGGCGTAVDPPFVRQVPLIGSAGQQLGTVGAWQTASAVGVRVQASGLPHGLHGIHVHSAGRCDPPGFTSAGDHWNPTGRRHGLQSPQGPHGGDLPNLSVASNGVANEAAILSGASIAALSDANGSALVIHGAPDDHVTDPSGNSGARIACAVIAPPAG